MALPLKYVFRATALITLLAAASLAAARGYDVPAAVEQVLSAVRDAGPAGFFLAMAVLPAAGVPLSFFTLAAGPVFGPTLGMPQVLLFSASAIAANMALAYLLAHRTLRPLLVRLLRRLGYGIPSADAGDADGLALLLRVTPGIPFAVQNYMLGLAAVPFGRYMLVSCLVAFPLNAAIVVFGSALLQGPGRTAALALMLMLAVMAAVRLLRRRLVQKVQPAEKDRFGT
jgi:uncharacterized membrane protein YdjX (TVP38/TMEM64 family)